MAIRLQAVEKSSCIITISFLDEDGAAAIPTSIVWTLTDRYGSVIDSLNSIPIATPAQTVDILLEGDNLSLLPSESKTQIVKRLFTVEAIYTYDGSPTNLKDSLIFTVKNLKNIS